MMQGWIGAFQSGRFDPSNVEPDTFGPHGFDNPLSLVDWLKNNQPPIDSMISRQLLWI